MAFPQTPLDVRAELSVSGVWTDITADALARDRITITRGRPDESSAPEPCSMSLSLKNPSGKYSPRNPTGPYYGSLGRNTPLRVGVGVPPVGLGQTGQTGTSIVAPSVAAETAGIHLAAWAAKPVGNVTTPGGYTASTERDGGSATFQAAYKTVSAGTTGTATATFSTASTASVGLSVYVPGASVAVAAQSSAVTAAASTSLGPFAVTAGEYVVVVVGWSGDARNLLHGAPADTDGTHNSDWVTVGDTGASAGPRLRGWIRRVKTTGTMTVSVPAPDALTDVYVQAWRLTGVTDYYPRMVGECGELPVRWDLSGADVWSPVTAAGILRRLGQGTSPIRSPLRRAISNLPNLVAYWPMEDAEGSTEFASALGGSAMQFGTVTGVTVAGNDLMPASEPLPTFQSAGATGRVPAYTDTGAGWGLFGIFAMPASGSGLLLNINCAGGVGGLNRVTLEYETGSGLWTISYYDTAGGLGGTSTSGLIDPRGHTFAIWLECRPNGGNVDLFWKYAMIDQYRDANLIVIDGDSAPAAVLSGTPGRVTSVTVGNGSPALSGPVTVGHYAVFSSGSIYNSYFTQSLKPALVAYAGERADDRLARLCREERIDYYTTAMVPTGNVVAPAAAPMGEQPIATLVDILTECATADGGVLYEPRGFLGLAYRTRRTKYNQAAAATLSYTAKQIAEPFEPTDDDQHVNNDVTVSRPNGTEFRAILSTGALSVNAPPSGVGRYDTAIEANVWNDRDLSDQAGWRLAIGTWDETRYPAVAVELAAAISLIPAVPMLDIGDRFTLTNLPAWLPPGGADLIHEGYSESLGHVAEWPMVLNATPTGPYRVGLLDSGTYARLDSTTSTLSAGATSGATSLSVAQGTGPPWTTTATRPSDFPFDCVVAGEQVTVTAIANVLTDTFTRSVTDGWSVADSGQAWTLTGTAANFDVTNPFATHTNSSAVDTFERATVALNLIDFDEVGEFMFVNTPTGGALTAELAGRVGGTSLVLARLTCTTASALDISIIGNNGASTLASRASLLTGVVPVQIKARFRADGASLMLKVWLSTSSEPRGWHLEATDTLTPSAGANGVRFARLTGNTNVNPVIRTYDFAVTNPQTFTVTRSVNGVVKAQSSGAQIRLYQPTAWAL